MTNIPIRGVITDGSTFKSSTLGMSDSYEHSEVSGSALEDYLAGLTDGE